MWHSELLPDNGLHFLMSDWVLFTALQLRDCLQKRATSLSGKSALHVIPTGHHRHFSLGSVQFGIQKQQCSCCGGLSRLMFAEVYDSKLRTGELTKKQLNKNITGKIPLFLFFFFLTSFLAWPPGSGIAVTSSAFQVGKEDVSFQHSQQINTTHVSQIWAWMADWFAPDALYLLCISHTWWVQYAQEILSSCTASPVHSRSTDFAVHVR